MAIRSVKLAVFHFCIAAFASLEQEVQNLHQLSENIDVSSSEIHAISDSIGGVAPSQNFLDVVEEVLSTVMDVTFDGVDLFMSHFAPHCPENVDGAHEWQMSMMNTVDQIFTVVAEANFPPGGMEQMVGNIHRLASHIQESSAKVHDTADNIQKIVNGRGRPASPALVGTHSPGFPYDPTLPDQPVFPYPSLLPYYPVPSDDPVETMRRMANVIQGTTGELPFLIPDGAPPDFVVSLEELVTVLHDKVSDMTSEGVCAGDDSMSELEEVVTNIQRTLDDINTRSSTFQDIIDQLQSVMGDGPRPDDARVVMDMCQVLTSLAVDMVPIVVAVGVNHEAAVNVSHQILEVVDDIMSFVQEGIPGERIPVGGDRVAELTNFTHWLAGEIERLSSGLHPMIDSIPRLLAAGAQTPPSLAQTPPLSPGKRGDDPLQRLEELHMGFSQIFFGLVNLMEDSGLSEEELGHAEEIVDRLDACFNTICVLVGDALSAEPAR